MKIRVLGAGVYGSHIALALIAAGHDVDVHEVSGRLFNGASGNGPARCHLGPHYPRSLVTRAACQEHTRLFEARYGHLTSGVPINLYAIAHESLVDFGTYRKILRDEIEFITVSRLDQYGLINVEGAIHCGERHFVVDKAREWFTKELGNHVTLNQPPGRVDDARWDWTIDCSFCANDETGVDRFEACITVLIEGPVDKSITIVDGKFPGLYVWNEEKGLTSVTSAKYTPMARYPKWSEARAFLDDLSVADIERQSEDMVDQMAVYYPRVRDEYKIVGHLLAVRALPKSASDARLVDVIRVGERAIRVRAGKIDAIFQAEEIIKKMISEAA